MELLLNIFRHTVHYGFHIVVPFVIAWWLWRERWRAAGLIMVATMLSSQGLVCGGGEFDEEPQ